jgi:dTDP-4-amino-4,6-dideoxygalactose transaminase
VTTIPVARPLLDEREADAARRVILSGWVTQGPEVAAFEREFSAAVGSPYACAVSSCTTALHVALAACGVSAGDEVITVSHSFIATANAVRYCAATPVFVDIAPGSFNIDPARVEEAIGPRTRAILAVHQFGMPCELAPILEIARRRSVPVIEDAACAVGSEILWDERWERIGRPHGLIACFSFHPRKLLSTGDGGMLTTADAELDRRFRLLRQHGMSVSDTVRHAASTIIQEEYPVLGYNYRMTDIQAAIGREQLQRLPSIVSRRRDLAARYRRELDGEAGIELPDEPAWARTNWQSFTIRVERGRQRQIMQGLLDAGVSTRRGAMNAHREGAYPPGSWRSAGPLVESESAQDTSIVLPLFHQLAEPDQDRVVRELKRVVGPARP